MITAALAALPTPPAANVPPPVATPRGTVSEPPVAKPNHPEQLRQAQTELTRLGCFNGRPDGQLNEATRNALGPYGGTQASPSSRSTSPTTSLTNLIGYAGNLPAGTQGGSGGEPPAPA
jgi:hypothetical protein